MTSYMLRCLAAGLCLAAAPLAASAQAFARAFAAGQAAGLARVPATATASLAGSQGPSALCFRGAPQSRCGSFLLTEFGVGVGPSLPSRRPPANAVWEVGAMRNLDPSFAAGATVFGVYDDEERVLLGVKPRVRYWVSERISVDVAPGIVLTQVTEDRVPIRTPGFSGHVGLNAGDWASVFAQAEVLSVRRRSPQDNPELVGSQTAFLVGVRLGSYPGLLAGPLAAGVFRVFSMLE